MNNRKLDRILFEEMRRPAPFMEFPQEMQSQQALNMKKMKRDIRKKQNKESKKYYRYHLKNKTKTSSVFNKNKKTTSKKKNAKKFRKKKVQTQENKENEGAEGNDEPAALPMKAIRKMVRKLTISQRAIKAISKEDKLHGIAIEVSLGSNRAQLTAKKDCKLKIQWQDDNGITIKQMEKELVESEYFECLFNYVDIEQQDEINVVFYVECAEDSMTMLRSKNCRFTNPRPSILL